MMDLFGLPPEEIEKRGTETDFRLALITGLHYTKHDVVPDVDTTYTDIAPIELLLRFRLVEGDIRPDHHMIHETFDLEGQRLQAARYDVLRILVKRCRETHSALATAASESPNEDEVANIAARYERLNQEILQFAKDSQLDEHTYDDFERLVARLEEIKRSSDELSPE